MQRHLILVVEDEEGVRICLRLLAQRAGAGVLEAADAEEALRIWGEHKDDIRMIITDLMLGGSMNGHELAERLLKEKPEAKAICITGFDSNTADVTGFTDSRIKLMHKPFPLEEMEQEMRGAAS